MEQFYEHVLFIGPKNEYGGIGAVLRTYEKNIKNFNLIYSHKDQSTIDNIFYFIFTILKLNYFLIFNHKIKIIHVHSASKGSFIRKLFFSINAKLYRKKVVFHMHGGQFKAYYNQLKWSKKFIKLFLNQLDLFICLTEDWATYFKYELGIKRVAILGNPIHINSNYNQKPSSDTLNLLFLGTIHSKKGIFDLIHYLGTNIYFKQQKIHLKIGGLGEVDRLNNLISDPFYKDQIQYLGFISGDQKYDVISSCDMFILPSYYEGLPVSILEAMGYGKPIIATNVGGVASVVKNNTTGWLFEAGQFGQLDHILDEIFQKKSQLNQYQINAYQTAMNFSCQNILTQLSNEYKKILN